jgi:agmatine deiminase
MKDRGATFMSDHDAARRRCLPGPVRRAAAAALLAATAGGAPAVGVEWRAPAEWERQDAVWIGWRTRVDGAAHAPVVAEMVRTLAPHVAVRLVVEDPGLLPETAALLRGLGDPARVTVVYQRPTDFWFRDPGPHFLVGPRGRLRVADFLFSDYSNAGPRRLSHEARRQEGIDRDVARRLGAGTVRSHVVLEGGALEVNGAGAGLLSALTLRRNPHLTRTEIEQDLRRTLGLRRIVWLDEGLVEDAAGPRPIGDGLWGRGTGGHVDAFARFASADSILVADVAPDDRAGAVRAEDARRMAVNRRLLDAATDAEGRSFRVIPVPLPALHVRERPAAAADLPALRRHSAATAPGDGIHWAATASYLNFVVSNGVVLLPTYPGGTPAQRARDDGVGALFARLFPGRRIVRIDPLSLNWAGGGMHCLVRGQPSPGAR